MRLRQLVIGLALSTLLLVLGSLSIALAAGPIAPSGGVGTPNLVSPSNGSSSVAAPLLIWQPATEGVEYYVEVWSTAMPAGGTAQSGGLTTQTSHVPTSLGAGLWSWRVRALGVGNTFGPPSATRTFTILPSLTTAPSLTSPASGSVFTYPTNPAILRWGSVGLATSYDVQLATNATFTTGVETHRVPLPAMTAPIARLNATMHWRVRAVRGISASDEHTRELGPWSSVRTYSMAWPTAPTPTAPSNGASVATFVVAQWTPIAGAAGYEIASTTAADPGFTDATTNVVNEPWAYLTAPNGTTVLWRVRASVDGSTPSGVTPWSTVSSAVMDLAGAAPDEPETLALPQVALIGPADGVTVTSVIDEPFRWTPIAGARGYQVQSARDALDFDIVSPISSGPATFQMSNAAFAVAGETSKWRVRAVGGDGSAGPWSDVRRITIAPNVGSTLVSPASGASIPGSTASVTWSSAPTSGLHDVEFSRTADFADSRYHASILGTRLSASLRKGLWYWRVSDHGEPAISVSETRTLTIVDNEPPIGRVVLNGGSAFLAEGATLLNVYTDQQDLVGDLASIDLSWDGQDWTTHAVTGDVWSINLPVTSPDAGGTALGRRDVHISWTDADGNRTAPLIASVWYGVEPPETPGPPQAVTATPGVGQATVSWSAPQGGGPIIAYDAVTNYGHACRTTGSLSCTIPSLTAGVPYTVTVRAWNDVGGGPPSSSVTVTPLGTAPTATIIPLSSVQRSRSFAVSWAATAGTRPVASHDVRVRRAAWNGGFGAVTVWRTATTATAATFSGIQGSTYCFSSRARDVDGGTSGWTSETCTAVPLDDRSLSRSGTWAAITHASDYAGTALRSFTSGATLTRTGVVARRISLLVTTCPGCGSVRVYWQGVLVRTISLSSPTVAHRKVVSVVAFSSGRVGTLRIRVSSAGKPVFIDAVAISRL
ncbi:MAG: fibronectin type III domain-containing protein [Chloroflexota bacterium]|nr:fibronectin type III domain-containing protein [Chloroflexota bacterium]